MKITKEMKNNLIEQMKIGLTAGASLFIETGYSTNQALLIGVYYNGVKLASYHQFTSSISQVLQGLFWLNTILEDTEIRTCKGACYFIYYRRTKKKGINKNEKNT